MIKSRQNSHYLKGRGFTHAWGEQVALVSLSLLPSSLHSPSLSPSPKPHIDTVRTNYYTELTFPSLSELKFLCGGDILALKLSLSIKYWVKLRTYIDRVSDWRKRFPGIWEGEWSTLDPGWRWVRKTSTWGRFIFWNWIHRESFETLPLQCCRGRCCLVVYLGWSICDGSALFLSFLRLKRESQSCGLWNVLKTKGL